MRSDIYDLFFLNEKLGRHGSTLVQGIPTHPPNYQLQCLPQSVTISETMLLRRKNPSKLTLVIKFPTSKMEKCNVFHMEEMVKDVNQNVTKTINFIRNFKAVHPLIFAYLLTGWIGKSGNLYRIAHLLTKFT